LSVTSQKSRASLVGRGRAGPGAAGWPNEPVRTTPGPGDRPAATALSCAAVLHLGTQRAADSSPACASAPVDADAIGVVEGRGSPNPAPRTAGNALPSSTATTAAHPADPSSACAPAWCGSQPRSQSTVRTATRPASARTNASARWLPF